MQIHQLPYQISGLLAPVIPAISEVAGLDTALALKLESAGVLALKDGAATSTDTALFVYDTTGDTLYVRQADGSYEAIAGSGSGLNQSQVDARINALRPNALNAARLALLNGLGTWRDVQVGTTTTDALLRTEISSQATQNSPLLLIVLRDVDVTVSGTRYQFTAPSLVQIPPLSTDANVLIDRAQWQTIVRAVQSTTGGGGGLDQDAVDARIRALVGGLAYASADPSLSTRFTNIASALATLTGLTSDLEVVTHTEWANVPRVALGGFYMTGINDGDPQSGFGVQHTANAQGSSNNYLLRLLIPLGEELADFRLREGDNDITPVLWSQGPNETVGGIEYQAFGGVGPPEILPRGTTVTLQKSTRTRQTIYDGDLTAAAIARLRALLNIPTGGGSNLIGGINPAVIARDTATGATFNCDVQVTTAAGIADAATVHANLVGVAALQQTYSSRTARYSFDITLTQQAVNALTNLEFAPLEFEFRDTDGGVLEKLEILVPVVASSAQPAQSGVRELLARSAAGITVGNALTLPADWEEFDGLELVAALNNFASGGVTYTGVQWPVYIPKNLIQNMAATSGSSSEANNMAYAMILRDAPAAAVLARATFDPTNRELTNRSGLITWEYAALVKYGGAGSQQSGGGVGGHYTERTYWIYTDADLTTPPILGYSFDGVNFVDVTTSAGDVLAEPDATRFPGRALWVSRARGDNGGALAASPAVRANPIDIGFAVTEDNPDGTDPLVADYIRGTHHFYAIWDGSGFLPRKPIGDADVFFTVYDAFTHWSGSAAYGVVPFSLDEIRALHIELVYYDSDGTTVNRESVHTVYPWQFGALAASWGSYVPNVGDTVHIFDRRFQQSTDFGVFSAGVTAEGDLDMAFGFSSDAANSRQVTHWIAGGRNGTYTNNIRIRMRVEY